MNSGVPICPQCALVDLASLPPEAIVGAEYLAHDLDCTVDCLHAAVARGELPAPFVLMGRHCWRVGTVLERLAELQEEACTQQELTRMRRDHMAEAKSEQGKAIP